MQNLIVQQKIKCFRDRKEALDTQEDPGTARPPTGGRRGGQIDVELPNLDDLIAIADQDLAETLHGSPEIRRKGLGGVIPE
jgi:hypothetical protein